MVQACRVYASELRLEVQGFAIQALGFNVAQAFRIQALGFGFRLLRSRFWAVQGFEVLASGFEASGVRLWDVGFKQ